jgi:hypothetical protein
MSFAGSERLQKLLLVAIDSSMAEQLAGRTISEKQVESKASIILPINHSARKIWQNDFKIIFKSID